MCQMNKLFIFFFSFCLISTIACNHTIFLSFHYYSTLNPSTRRNIMTSPLRKAIRLSVLCGSDFSILFYYIYIYNDRCIFPSSPYHFIYLKMKWINQSTGILMWLAHQLLEWNTKMLLSWLQILELSFWYS